MIEDASGARIAAWRDVNAGLLVQPPGRQAEFCRYGAGLFQDCTMRLEDRVDVAGRSAGVIGKSHRRTAEHIYVSDQPACC